MADKEKTLQRAVIEEIKQIDGVTISEMATKIGITNPSMIGRLDGDCGVSKFWEILKALGYDMVLMKAPSDREAMVTVGNPSECITCQYKQAVEDYQKAIAKLQSL